MRMEPLAESLIGRFRRFIDHAILPHMSDQESDDGQIKQRMDTMLLRLLKTPPQSRAELAEQVRRAKGKPTRTHAKRASAQSDIRAQMGPDLIERRPKDQTLKVPVLETISARTRSNRRSMSPKFQSSR
jgi:hypothetical protein